MFLSYLTVYHSPQDVNHNMGCNLSKQEVWSFSIISFVDLGMDVRHITPTIQFMHDSSVPAYSVQVHGSSDSLTLPGPRWHNQIDDSIHLTICLQVKIGFKFSHVFHVFNGQMNNLSSCDGFQQSSAWNNAVQTLIPGVQGPLPLISWTKNVMK